MKRSLYILLLVFSVCSLHAQQHVFHAQVVDAETGEALPFVNVYHTAGRGSISNMEGNFTIMAEMEDTLCFSFVGYQTCKWKASKMPEVVKMRPATLSVAGVTVLSDDAILTRTFDELKKDFKKHVKEKRTYLNRITIKSGENREMVEDFLTARSAVNVRGMSVLSGQYWTRTIKGEQITSQLQHTNLHHLMMAGPMMRDVPLENSVLQPFPASFSASYLQYYFMVSSQMLQTDGGDLVYVVELRPKVETWKSILYGKLYIDAKTFHLLRFDGAVRGLMTSMHRLGENEEQGQPATIRLQIHYTHQRGFTEVENASAQIHSNESDVSMILADANDIVIPSNKGVSVKENLLKAIMAVGSRPKLHQEAQFIQWTEMEQVIAGNAFARTSTTKSASSLFTYIQKAMNFNKVVPQEKVYMHFDNMGYFENETMWFKAYVTRTDSGRATDLSKVLYVELLNPTGDVIKTRKYPIDSLGVAHGDMKLDTLFGSGFYEVRAYTRYMTNWGTNAVFSRVFPVFKKPQKEGDYSDLSIVPKLYANRDPNNRISDDSLYQRAIDEGIYTKDLMKTISVQFYPEGGSLIVGKRSRVALLAVDDNGRPHQGEGFVMNEKGDVLAIVETDSLGRGLFEVVPDAGKLTYQMRNLKKDEKSQVQFFTLPQARTQGCTLSVDAISERMLATIQCTDSVCGHLLGYVIMHNGNIIRCDTLTAVPLVEIEMGRQAMPDGVNQMTVFDRRGVIMAERLFFQCPTPNQEDSIRVTAVTKKLQPCGKVEMELHTQPHANLSFSAMDAHTMTNGKQGNMKTWMLLSSEVRGYIPNVDYYFEADDVEHRKSADLLMMTQGWRRYDWRLMTERYIFRKPQPIEDKMYLNGTLKAYRKHNPVNNVHIYVIMWNKYGQSMLGQTVTDSVGNYAFEMPFVDGEWKLCIYTTRKLKEEKRKTYLVGIDRQFSPKPRYITPVEAEIQHPLAPNAFVWNPQEAFEEDDYIPITEKEHVLKNVTVKRRFFTNDDWKFKNEAFGRQYATRYYDIDRERDNALDKGERDPYMLDFLKEKNPLFTYRRESRSYGVYGVSSNYNGLGALSTTLPYKFSVSSGGSSDSYTYTYQYDGKGVEWIFDNGERPNLHSRPEELFLSDVKSIYIVPDDPRTDDNRVRIYVYLHTMFTTESNKGLRRTYFQGFNEASTFKMEDYNVVPPMADFRRTIYWNPDVIADDKGNAKVEFFNNSTCREMFISVEGMSPEGQMLINR